MRVGIDALALGNQLDGSTMYVRNLIRALPTIDSTDDYTIFVGPSVATNALPETEHMRKAVVRSRWRMMRVPFATSVAIARARLDVMHVQFAAPLICPARIVVTVHDILFEHHPEFFDPAALRQLSLRVPRTLRRAAAVVTDSEFCKHDIVRWSNVPPEKVAVAYLAADPIFRPIRDAARLAAVRTRYCTGAHYILFVGALKPNKNVKVLVEAYVRLRRSGQIMHRLVLVGTTDWLRDDAFAAARAAGYVDELTFTGHVPDDDLVALYNAADLFVQPSLFEGFGLPSLEAMACGTPVVTSNAAAIPEVVGDAALTVDPLDVEALANAIAAVLGDSALHARLSARGMERAADFTWEATARTVLGVYQDAARGAHAEKRRA